MRDVIQIDIDKDSVTIEGQKVFRPSRISPSQWYAAWAALKKKADDKSAWWM